MKVAAVVIGRNEGARLRACLASLRGQVERIVYVDSGSSDGSVAAAQAFGAEVIELDLSTGFTAARARNAGIAALGGAVELVQFVDGDCTLDPGWIATATAFLEARPDVAVVCGRRREVAPEMSIYNRLIDREWNTPIGEAAACGGDALMRLDALQSAGGYRASLIAGEEPELCLRLRRAGWKIWRLDAEMTAHDARLTRFSQWWQRARRAGHAFAEGAWLHGTGPERHWVAETRRTLIWAVLLPLLIAGLAFAFTPWFLGLLVVYPLQVLRLARRGGWGWAVFSVLGRFAEAQGVWDFARRRLLRRQSQLIEYRSSR